MKIIAVDDENDALSNFLLSVVDESGLEYKLFRNNPCAAVDYVRTSRVDAAFLDIQMPQINGIELAEKLIQVCPSIKIVFVSAYTQDEKAVELRLKDNLAGFCYKPYKQEQLYGYIKQISTGLGGIRRVFIKTFGAFDLLIDDKPVKISSTKAKELLALLVDKNGAHVGMNDAICALWPDKSLELSKILYRDAVWRLRQTLNDCGLQNLVSFFRACQVINKDCAVCDYWEYLGGRGKELYCGSYLQNYDWSMDTQSALDSLKLK